MEKGVTLIVGIFLVFYFFNKRYNQVVLPRETSDVQIKKHPKTCENELNPNTRGRNTSTNRMTDPINKSKYISRTSAYQDDIADDPVRQDWM